MLESEIFEKPPCGAAFSNPSTLTDLRLGVVALRRKVWYSVFGAASKRQAVGPRQGAASVP